MDSTIICDEVIDADADTKSNDTKVSRKDDKTNFNKKICKTQSFYVLLAFLLITIALLIAVSIYCYLLKDRAKQLLPFHYTNSEFREVLY